MKKFYAIALVGFVGVLLGSSIVKADTLFAKDLYFGIQSDPDVTKLQEFLTDQNLYSGPITGNFFSLTLAGVKSFQSREGISPIAGYFGPRTRAKANLMLSQQVQASDEQALAETSSTPPVTTPPATTNDINNSLQEQLTLMMQQIALLQAQLQAQQSSTQAIQNLQGQVQQQTQTIQQQSQTLQQIQQNTTQPIQVVVQPASPPPPPPPLLPEGIDLAVTATPSGLTTNRQLSQNDDLATINFIAGINPIQLNSITLTFGGNVPSVAGFFNTGPANSCSICGPIVQLYDNSNATTYGAVASSTINQTLSYHLLGYTVSANTSKGFKLRINSQSLLGQIYSTNNSGASLSASISNNSSVIYTRGVSATSTPGLTLQSGAPIQIQSVIYVLPSPPATVSTSTATSTGN